MSSFISDAPIHPGNHLQRYSSAHVEGMQNEATYPSIAPFWKKLKNGSLQPVWTAAFYKKKLNKRMVLQCQLQRSCGDIRRQAFENKVSLRWIGMLLHGACIIYSKKMDYLVQDSDDFSQRLALAFEEKQLKKKRNPKAYYEQMKMLSIESNTLGNTDEQEILNLVPLPSIQTASRLRVSDDSLQLQDDTPFLNDDVDSQFHELPDLAADLAAMGKTLQNFGNSYPKYYASDSTSSLPLVLPQELQASFDGNVFLDGFEQPVASHIFENQMVTSPFKAHNPAYQPSDVVSFGKRASEYTNSVDSSPFDAFLDLNGIGANPGTEDPPVLSGEDTLQEHLKFVNTMAPVSENTFNFDFMQNENFGEERSRTKFRKKHSILYDDPFLLSEKSMREWMQNLHSIVIPISKNPFLDKLENGHASRGHPFLYDATKDVRLLYFDALSKRKQVLEKYMNSSKSFASFCEYGVNLSNFSIQSAAVDSLTEHLRDFRGRNIAITHPLAFKPKVIDSINDPHAEASYSGFDGLNALDESENENFKPNTPLALPLSLYSKVFEAVEDSKQGMQTPIKTVSERRRSVKRNVDRIAIPSEERSHRFDVNQTRLAHPVKWLLHQLRHEWTMTHINDPSVTADEEGIENGIALSQILSKLPPLSVSRILCDLLVLETKGILTTAQEYGEDIHVFPMDNFWNLSLESDYGSSIATPLVFGRFRAMEVSLPTETPFHTRLLTA